MADQAAAQGERDGILAFCVLACAITWTLDAPLAVSWARGVTPPPYALPLCGLGAFGPTLAAVLVAARQGKVRAIFARWRTAPRWIALALVLPLLLHLIATAICRCARRPAAAHWFYRRTTPSTSRASSSSRSAKSSAGAASPTLASSAASAPSPARIVLGVTSGASGTSA